MQAADVDSLAADAVAAHFARNNTHDKHTCGAAGALISVWGTSQRCEALGPTNAPPLAAREEEEDILPRETATNAERLLARGQEEA